ncbi:hypothetical protein SNOG_01241 [Parastagonospora nodorum SN15]|uniref:Uncharacterized protein n=1 Tax=Phaeosphaeria nodorum (strain SN15 / ATCC MYA-4574 / FGSC 10173) TaxID=321614 RepID=Q0V423_PHANO|nr:hypothetical protein SNOG_01241 [Parastagonospora nodorum SN15]EAT90890.1 hypothetical protein SNOG_01241 [Parastagonospora nodorum SN15]
MQYVKAMAAARVMKDSPQTVLCERHANMIIVCPGPVVWVRRSGEPSASTSHNATSGCW